VYKRAYALQFHLEVSPQLAAEWGEVPSYAESLEAIQGPGALQRLVGEVAEHAGTMVPLARRLFGGWLERVVRVPAQAIG
jgi:GMP synthase (glutamine-hydrolysing)